MEDHLEKWGTPHPTHYPWNPVTHYLSPMVSHDTLCCFQPAPSTEKPAMLAIWPNRAAYDVGESKRLRGRPGKMLKRLLPEATLKQIEEFSNWYSERYDPQKLTLHVADDADSFVKAYSHTRAEFKNPRTTSARKSLASSCMRGDFNGNHPAQAYASGDFEIVYLTNPQGEIAGRCVVRKDPPVAAPAYGVSEDALDMLESHLKGRGVTLFNDGVSSWEGARLLRLEHPSQGFIAPYLDRYPQRLTDNSHYLVVDRHGSIDASNYSGVLGGYDDQCYECGGHLHEDDSYNQGGNTYCESCHDDLFRYCELCGDYEPSDDFQSYETRHGTESCCEHCFYNNSFILETKSGEYWHEDDTEVTAEGFIISTSDYEDYYFTSDWDHQIYHNDEACLTVDGETVSRSELEADADWEEIDGTWSKKEAA